MSVLKRISSPRAVLALMGLVAFTVDWRATAEPLPEGSVITLGERVATLQRLDTLPYVENGYTRRFKFDAYENPKLTELRTRFRLEAVVAPGQDEFAQQLRLLNWTHQQFKKFGQPSTSAQGALEILKAINEGHTFFCSQYAQLLVSAAASLGWVDRPLALRRHQGVAKVGGSTEHSVTEIWSNQHRKWVMLDPTSDLYLEKNGLPLSAFEIRQEWFYQAGTNLIFVIGPERNRYRKSDLPIVLQHFPNFGDLTVQPDELDKYGFTAFIPNTDLMDSGFDYGGMFIVQDSLCEGTKWHVRTVPTHPEVDPYFPLGQAALNLSVEEGQIRVTLKTLTPNFDHFEVCFDDKGWHASEDSFVWDLHSGPNRMEARTLNRFGVTGPRSSAVLEVVK